MNRILLVIGSIALGLAASQSARAADDDMTFFLTSAGPGNGADLGGLAGADKHCQMLAEGAGAGGHAWRAYLSTTADGDDAGVNARDRIGNGPWTNAKGVVVATSVEDLHGDSNKLGKENSISETGDPINGRGDSPNRHDILTGSELDGTAYPADIGMSCGNWTLSGADGSARVGHHDLSGRAGPGRHPESWNSAHPSRGCGQSNLQDSGGDGLFYCFAAE